MKLLNKNTKVKLDDIALVHKYKESSNTVYIGILFERYFYLVYGVCLKYLQDIDESKDAVNQIFESLFIKLKDNEITNFSSWLYSVTKNHCLMAIRSSDRRHKREEVFEKEIKDNSNMIFDEDSRYNDINIKELRTIIEQLKTEQKECIELFYLQEKSYNEVSDITGYSLSKVKSYIQNGKRNLKLILEKNGYKQ